MKSKVKEVADIKTGVFASSEPDPELKYIQASHFNIYGQFNKLVKPSLGHNKWEKHLLQDGDVLFAAKSRNNFAVPYTNNIGPAVASSSFFVMRLSTKRVLPEYLTWYINLPTSQQYFKAFARGSALPSVSKGVLEEFEIDLPPMDKQKMIVEIYKLYQMEKIIKQELKEKRELLIQQQLLNAAKI